MSITSELEDNSWSWLYLGFCVVGVIGGFFAGIAYMQSNNATSLSIANNLAPTISAISSFILAIVTITYAISTKKLVKENRMARHQEVAPVLKSGTTFHNYGKIAVTLKNIGNFPAQEINTEVELHPNGGKDELKTHRINPNEQVALVEPFEGVDFERGVQKKYENFTIRGTCKDMFGRERKIDDKFDLSLLEEGVSRSLDKDEESEKINALDGIAHEIGKINDKLDDSLIK